MKERFARILLLTSLPGLMFCIIPVHGTEFNLSWQLASVWLGGLAFTALLTGWWLRVFWLICLAVTMIHFPPVYDAYISLITVAVFLAAVEGFSRIDGEKEMDAICIAAIALLCWMLAQRAGWATAWFGVRSVGPFNPDAGGVFLALCLPACLRGKWMLLAPFIVCGLVVSGTTTGAMAALAGMAVYLYLTVADKRKIIAWGAALAVLAGVWFWKVDSLDNMVKCNRWIAWKHAAWSMRSEMLGRGMGSWEVVFPLLASGDTRLGTVNNENGKIEMNNVFCQAHNEYVQAAFELGVQTFALIGAFLIFVAVCILRKSVSAEVAAGMTALAISCFGWHVFHIPPVALLGCAWLGMWQRRVERA